MVDIVLRPGGSCLQSCCAAHIVMCRAQLLHVVRGSLQGGSVPEKPAMHIREHNYLSAVKAVGILGVGADV